MPALGSTLHLPRGQPPEKTYVPSSMTASVKFHSAAVAAAREWVPAQVRRPGAPRQRASGCARARAHAHFAHDELLALAHLAIGFEERSDTGNGEIVERLPFGAITPLSFVQPLCFHAIAFGVFTRIGVCRRFRVCKVKRAQRGNHIFSQIEERLVGAWSGRKL